MYFLKNKMGTGIEAGEKRGSCSYFCAYKKIEEDYLMAGINAEHINVFLMAATKILSEMCGLQPKVGKPYVRKNEFAKDTLVIMIGVTGEMKGQVMLSLPADSAKDIASKMMMGMPVNELDDMAKSAICELGNMVMGNASTVFSVKGIGIDITPPTMFQGDFSMNAASPNMCIPIVYEENKSIELNLALKQD